jgi:hypothetical protein
MPVAAVPLAAKVVRLPVVVALPPEAALERPSFFHR